ncbi:hypothetical protein F4819DRAFT_473268 [Hypoxylon fuscum]|nr:hypothetical protein F4819DRAFT_473268 [Hypoxylon fuscum]
MRREWLGVDSFHSLISNCPRTTCSRQWGVSAPRSWLYIRNDLIMGNLVISYPSSHHTNPKPYKLIQYCSPHTTSVNLSKMQQITTSVHVSQSKPIPIPVPSKKNNLPLLDTRPFMLKAGSPAFSDCESALDEDENAYDMFHLPFHHRRNALSFEDGFEFPAFLRRLS